LINKDKQSKGKPNMPTILEDMQKYRSLMEDGNSGFSLDNSNQSSGGNSQSDDHNNNQSNNENGNQQNGDKDSQKMQLINDFAKGLNPGNAQTATDALTALYKNTAPSSSQVQALAEIVANVFKACETKSGLLQAIKGSIPNS